MFLGGPPFKCFSREFLWGAAIFFAVDAYTIKPRKTRDGFDLESERLSHGSLWYLSVPEAIGFAKWHSRVKDAKIEVCNEREEVVQIEELRAGDFAY